MREGPVVLKAISVVDHVHAPAGRITLDETARHRRRMRMVSDEGIEFLLDLPQARLLRNGEGMVLDDGRIIEVIAAAEPLYEVRGRDAGHLLRLAWQLGNRHLAAQILPDRILIRRDAVIGQMLAGLGASVAEIEAAFDPEGGAYDGGSHDHSHAGGHAHHHHD